MRISFVLPDFADVPVGGYKVVYEYANRLTNRGHSVSIFYKSPRSWRIASVYRAFRLLLTAVKTRILKRPKISWFNLDRDVRLRIVPKVNSRSLGAADAVIATAWQTAHDVAVLSADCGRKFYLVQDYETWNGAEDDVVQETFLLGLTIIAISRWLYELSIQLGAQSVHHVPNGLDHALFRTTTQPTLRSPKIVALYSNEPRKGLAVLIESLSYVHQHHPDVPICLFGVPRRPDDLPDWINYSMRPSSAALVALYNSASIFTSASLLEGWSLPAAEAIACGCAFVGTDSKGPRDFVTDGQSALLSAPGNSAVLGQNLRAVIEDKAMRNKLQVAGVQAIRELNWERSTRLMEACLSGKADEKT